MKSQRYQILLLISIVMLLDQVIAQNHSGTPIKSVPQESIIDFESDKWNIQSGEIVQFMDRKCFIGTAFLKDVEFQNGIIEVDIAVTGQKHRSYPGILFRVQSPGNWERFYIRPHRASLYPDALQYTPAFNGIDGWQLYNGEGYTKAADIPDNQWVHFKIEVWGNQAQIYMDDMHRPVLVIPELKHGVSKGYLGLLGPINRTAYFSNFKYRIDNSLQLAPIMGKARVPGIIEKWQLSQPFQFSQIDLEKHPDKQDLGEITWREVTSEASGLVDISRIQGRTSREPDCILAKTTLYSHKEKIMNLQFGYSDLVTLFLNGKPLFFGNSVYQGRDPSFLGIIGYNDALYVPLKKGDNELYMWITEVFGGWGLMAKDGDAVFEHEGVSQVWKIEHSLKMPESALYDKERDVIYISNFDQFSAPGQQFISKVTTDGKIQELKWVQGLYMPTGMAMFNHKLLVVERRNVVEIDVDLGEIVNRYPFPQAMFANDIAIDQQGDMYVSDSRKGAIYRFSNGQCEEWIKRSEFAGLNGLYIFKDKLIAGVSIDHSLKSIDLETKQIDTIIRFSEGIMDGIKKDKKGNFLISHYEGRIYRIDSSGKATILLNVPGSRCADFEYIADKDLLVIPTLEGNEVMGYKMVN